MRAKVVALLTMAVMTGCAGTGKTETETAPTEPGPPTTSASPTSEQIDSRLDASGQSPSGGAGTPDVPAIPLTSSRKPIPVAGGGSSVRLRLTGYEPGSSAVVHYGNTEVATLAASSEGVVTGPLTLPSGPPGVHVLEVRGHTATGAAYGHDLRVTYPGSPKLGQAYTLYVDGFEVRPENIDSSWTPEEVTVFYAGLPLFSGVVDIEGGILVTVPIPHILPAQPIALLVASHRSDLVRKVLLEPTP